MVALSDVPDERGRAREVVHQHLQAVRVILAHEEVLVLDPVQEQAEPNAIDAREVAAHGDHLFAPIPSWYRRQ